MANRIMLLNLLVTVVYLFFKVNEPTFCYTCLRDFVETSDAV